MSAACCAPSRAAGAVPDGGRRAPTTGAPPLESTAPPASMARIPGGAFRMGSDAAEAFPADGEGPVRDVTVSAFVIDRCAVTAGQFAEFVAATGYVTEAEAFGWSFVFAGLATRLARRSAVRGRVEEAPWWLAVEGADWQHPFGPDSDLSGVHDHPVTHVSWNDAAAFASWRGCRLPTEAEWERAARGGLDQAQFPWGDELTPGGEHRANIWQGTFPTRNTAEDGYRGTAPVDAFAPNGFGLHNMSGNVWEWVADRFSADWHVPASNATRVDPRGPQEGGERVLRGGSYLCHHSYCNRYRCAGRIHNSPDTSTGHAGFRCATDG